MFPERYPGYLYAYPHKTAYRTLPRRPLHDVWADEDRSALFLYLHVPFCEMRCGFCNLFTQSRPGPSRVEAWLAALARQATATAAALGDATFARLALGGGTPTMLEVHQLAELLDLAERMGASSRALPTSVEASPKTATPERLALLRERGVDRISIGIESLDAAELRALGRPQQQPTVDRALDAIREAGFPTLNLDLIYGAPGQTAASWRATLDGALTWSPEELYLYPLYVRPLTGLGRGEAAVELDGRPRRYAEACERLAGAGYHQVSMRRFQRQPPDAVVEEPSYDCQDDGMVGLGCGARSYTRGLHYSHDYAVARDQVAGIIDGYVGATGDDHAHVHHGIELDEDEQRRRHVIKSVLRRPGLDVAAYETRFGTRPADDLGLLVRWVDDGLLEATATHLVPTAVGLAWSDAMGSALISGEVAALMADHEGAMKLSVLYRGPLASCNYGCGYCPFAKRHDPSAALAADAAMLERFVAWCRDGDDVDLSILFTPWGEALTRRWYRDAMVTLSHLPHVALVSAQTNLSQDVGWVAAADPERLRLWCTYHPTETDRATFVRRSQDLHQRGIAHSAGVVGFPAHLSEARRLRADLDPTTYLWVNPAEGLGRPYTDDEVAAWSAVDPLFELALRDMASAGRPCRTGEEVISVDGAGDVRRCHFVDQVIANIYDPDWRTALAPRPCPNATCDCFIGYVHRDRDLYDEHFGATLLTRIPSLRRPG